MKLLARLGVSLLPFLLLSGCESKPKPAEVPKQDLEPPKTRPMPGGSSKPTATSQLPRPVEDAPWRAT
jgi:hypothetical protein